jgi:hypothetical protein
VPEVEQEIFIRQRLVFNPAGNDIIRQLPDKSFVFFLVRQEKILQRSVQGSPENAAISRILVHQKALEQEHPALQG